MTIRNWWFGVLRSLLAESVSAGLGLGTVAGITLIPARCCRAHHCQPRGHTVPDTTKGPASSRAAGQGDANCRRLTREECRELLARPVAGVFSSLAEQGWIHSVPVHFLHRDGEIRICCRTRSVKALNVGRSRRGTLCVEVTNGPERRYVTVEGPARVERPATARDLAALDEKYSRTDTAGWSEADYAAEAVIVITPARWIAWSYWD